MPEYTAIDYIIGMPPANLEGRTNTVMENAMPICRIYPGLPSFTKGLTLFQRVKAFQDAAGADRRSGGTVKEKSSSRTNFRSLLNQYGFDVNQPKSVDCLTVAYQADSFPTDSFTNEYGENFLQKFTDVASEGAASIAQMMGARSATEALNTIAGNLPMGDQIQAGLKKAGNMISNVLPSSISGGVDLTSRLAAGSRIDFPMVWKTSGFQPSYTMTIRLYNPNPGNPEVTKKYIVAPIAALMLLGIPYSQDGITYSWPFIHRIVSPGIYDLDPAFISNITIIKGGDQQQIAYTQKMGVVDVRIDFGSLFSSMLASGKDISRTRPTLRKYLQSLEDQKYGIQNFSTKGQTEEQVQNFQAEQNASSRAQSVIQTKDQAPQVVEPTAEEIQNPPNRISQTLENIADQLISRSPINININL